MFNESEIIENLNTYYEYKQQYPEDKYIYYLRSLNLKELSQSVLEEQLIRLNTIQKQKNTILNSRPIVKDLKKLFIGFIAVIRSEEHTSELQSPS